jgi:hypothetical protein
VHTLANPGDPIQAAQGVGVVNMEGELAAVIGKRTACLTAENALDHVLGYTVVNDVTNADQGSIDEKSRPALTTRPWGRGSKPRLRIPKTSAPWQSLLYQCGRVQVLVTERKLDAKGRRREVPPPSFTVRPPAFLERNDGGPVLS